MLKEGAEADREARRVAYSQSLGRTISDIEAAARSKPNWVSMCTESLNKVSYLLRLDELKDATTILELALWKAKMEERGANDNNRETCRIDVTGAAQDAIVQYL